jgi:hypothetical protein
MGLALLGDKLSAEQAQAWGMIWQVVDDELSTTAQQMALHFASQPTFGLGLIKQAINAAETNTLDAQLDLERDYQRLAGRSDDYREGVSAFWRSARRTLRGNKMLNIRTVAVIGSGTMGAGIAEVAASHGHQVLLYDIASDAISRAIDGIRQRLASRVTRGKLSADASAQILARLLPVTDITALSGRSELVIEAASERLEVKKALFAQLAEICPPQTLLTSNTSSISVTAIAADVMPPGVAGCTSLTRAAGDDWWRWSAGWRPLRKWQGAV